ncbi:MAG: DNA polymerase Y family protein [Burkholderiales bacterium]|nr:DNA polymerase Y family protein [Burkholderiales bacterium]
MLWIALHLPELPLQSIEARLYPAPDRSGTQTPFAHAICEGPDTRPVLCAVNAVGRALGVRVGQTVSMARSLVETLVVTPRNPAWEDEALVRIATIASEFTPTVSLAQACVLLEVSTSLTLFGGPAKLLQLLRVSLRHAGYRSLTGVAPTPLAASLLARARMTSPSIRGTLDIAQLADRLAGLPLALFDWPNKTLTTLSQLGITRVRDLAPLPRDGVSRRFGTQVLNDLDRALGRVPDPRPSFSLPERFSSRIEFMREVDHFEGLRFPIRRMLGELESFLRARGAGTSAFTLTFEHSREHRSALTLSMQHASRQRERWESQLVERVTRTPLAGSVSAITLACEDVKPYQAENLSWLPTQHALDHQVGELSEKLAARLGEERVFGIQLKDDHRPEQSWRTKGPGEASQRTLPAPWPRRPIWLLEAPRQLPDRNQVPQLKGELAFLAGPERIETGWWDGKPARRDYFIAENPLGETVWVYRELHTPHHWFLHGYFA